ncbi:MAG: phosphoenolpyruvate carboxykinase (GTP), partial [Desulfobacteraceae bacterium]
PFAMLPFCGYHMGDYFRHWIDMGKKTDPAKLPKIFYVNWFRKSAQGKFLWPGYGENSRILKWVIERISGTGKAQMTPIGNIPADGALDLTGLNLSLEAVHEILKVDIAEWRNEIPGIQEHFSVFGTHLPKELVRELEALQKRLEV